MHACLQPESSSHLHPLQLHMRTRWHCCSFSRAERTGFPFWKDGFPIFPVWKQGPLQVERQSWKDTQLHFWPQSRKNTGSHHTHTPKKTSYITITNNRNTYANVRWCQFHSSRKQRLGKVLTLESIPEVGTLLVIRCVTSLSFIPHLSTHSGVPKCSIFFHPFTGLHRFWNPFEGTCKWVMLGMG